MPAYYSPLCPETIFPQFSFNWHLLSQGEWVISSLEAVVCQKEKKGVVQCSCLGEIGHKVLEGLVIMPGHGQVVVGVLIEVDVGKSGALLVQEEVAKDPKLVCV